MNINNVLRNKRNLLEGKGYGLLCDTKPFVWQGMLTISLQMKRKLKATNYCVSAEGF